MHAHLLHSRVDLHLLDSSESQTSQAVTSTPSSRPSSPRHQQRLFWRESPSSAYKRPQKRSLGVGFFWLEREKRTDFQRFLKEKKTNNRGRASKKYRGSRAGKVSFWLWWKRKRVASFIWEGNSAVEGLKKRGRTWIERTLNPTVPFVFPHFPLYIFLSSSYCQDCMFISVTVVLKLVMNKKKNSWGMTMPFLSIFFTYLAWIYFYFVLVFKILNGILACHFDFCRIS